MSNYQLGVGRINITIKRKGVQLQGMADPHQLSEGVLHSIYSRAFVIRSGVKELVIVVADIWSCTRSLKLSVIDKVNRELAARRLSAENVMIMGTHTHSAPGGYSGYELYDQPGKKNPKIITEYVDGISRSILNAIKDLAPGKLYMGRGEVQNCGEQRSLSAYMNNPKKELEKYSSDTDKEMTLLKFTHIKGVKEKPIGVITWYAIHPTDLGQLNKLVSGDNKGYASQLFETYAKEKLSNSKLVAAFANSNCGDVSGNVSTGIPNGKDDLKQMKRHGKLQFRSAKSIYSSRLTELKQNLTYWYDEINMSNLHIKNTHYRTWPYALGLSFAAGSTEDSVSVFKNPITGNREAVKNVKEGLRLPDIKGTKYNRERAVMSAALAIKLGTTPPLLLPSEEKKGHYPKPILLAPRDIHFLVPSVLPIQIFQIGTFVIAGFPGELTTMAGRRLRAKLLRAFESQGVQYAAIACYANDYAQYVTTREEYNVQDYEGASTAFGPHTLSAYLQEYDRLLHSEDQYIDCENRDSKELRFQIKFDLNGKIITYTNTKNVQFYRFSIPSSVRHMDIRARWKTSTGNWKNTRWLKVGSMGVGSAVHVIFDKRTVKSLGQVLKKSVRFTYGGIEKAVVACRYINRKGKEVELQSPSITSNYHDFDIPWNAKNIRLIAGLRSNTGKKRLKWTPEIKIKLSSHQRILVNLENGALKQESRMSPWW